jgi:hypothetical protein
VNNAPLSPQACAGFVDLDIKKETNDVVVKPGFLTKFRGNRERATGNRKNSCLKT